MSDDAARLERVRKTVAAVYERNRQQGHAAWCDRDYDFVCPSTGTYPFQWLWDSCFHAVVLSHLDIARAESEIRSLLENQQPDGFVAHVTFWQRERYEEMLKTYAIAYRTPYLSDCMQPPLLAEAVEAIAKRGGSKEFLAEVLPKVRRFYDWLDRVRDPDQDGLVANLQPDESGLDHTPKYDEYLGLPRVDHGEHTKCWERVANAYKTVDRDPKKMFELDVFVVEDVLVNSIYGENERVLAELLAQAGDAAGAAEMKKRAARTRDSLVKKCFDEEAGLFFDLASNAERKLRVSTVSCFLPLILPDLPRTAVDALVKHLVDPADYAASYPVPTVSMKEATFAPGFLQGSMVWRGPSWINTNWYIARGLRRHGQPDLARHIEERSADLIEGFGLREYYNPHTGEGFGAKDFSWSGLALDMLSAR